MDGGTHESACPTSSAKRRRNVGEERSLIVDEYTSVVSRAAPNAVGLTDADQDWFRDHLAHWLGARTMTTLAPMSEPYHAPLWRSAVSRGRPKEVTEFFRRCLDVYRAVLAGELPPIVAQVLFGDCPSSFGLEFHRRLGAAALTVPRSFRTDESFSGKIFEVQVPGSGWGDYLLMSEFYDRGGVGTRARDTASRYIDGLRDHCGAEDPRLLYLYDTCTSQVGARYFVQRTRELGLRFYGWDPDVGMRDVDYIKSHEWNALWTDHHVRAHIREAMTNHRLYDLPPNWMFWTKVICALPFWRLTSDFFTQRDRDLFAYTAILEPDGVQLADGRFLSRDEFLATRPKDRKYFLKYAGFDMGRNGGSRGVYRTDTGGQRTPQLIQEAWDESATRGVWIIQETVEDDLVEGVVDLRLARQHSKYSVLCAFEQYYGSILMLRKHFKVHGQADAAISVAIEDLRL
jgi:hypothetical protein